MEKKIQPKDVNEALDSTLELITLGIRLGMTVEELENIRKFHNVLKQALIWMN